MHLSNSFFKYITLMSEFPSAVTCSITCCGSGSLTMWHDSHCVSIHGHGSQIWVCDCKHSAHKKKLKKKKSCFWLYLRVLLKSNVEDANWFTILHAQPVLLALQPDTVGIWLQDKLAAKKTWLYGIPTNQLCVGPDQTNWHPSNAIYPLVHAPKSC